MLLTASVAAAQAALVRDLDPRTAPRGSHPHAFGVAGGWLFFLASDPVHGDELWVTDGTPAGTRLLADLRPGPASAFDYGFSPLFASAGGNVYFAAQRDELGLELWVVDSTALSVRLVRDLNPGPADGVAPGSDQLDAPERFGPFAPLGGRLVFSGTTPASGAEPWVTDGTAAGTLQITEINAGATSTPIWSMASLGSTVFFGALPGTNSRIYRTDGTAAGTQPAGSYNGMGPNGLPNELVAAGGFTYYLTPTGVQFTNGASSTSVFGTSPVLRTVASGPRVFFFAPTYVASSPLGSDAGVQLSADAPDLSPSAPRAVATDGGIWWPTQNASGLWFSDTALAGRAASLRRGRALTVLGGRAIVDGTQTLGGPMSVWAVEPSNGSAALLANVSVTAARHPMSPEHQGRVFFGTGDAGSELWVTGGTPATTLPFAELTPDVASSAPRHLTPFGGRTVFVAGDGDGGRALWSTDGTSPGTSPLPGTSSVVQLTSGAGGLVLRTDRLLVGDGAQLDPIGTGRQVGAFAATPRAVYFVEDAGLGAGRLMRWSPDAGNIDVTPPALASVSLEAVAAMTRGRVLFFSNAPGASLWLLDSDGGARSLGISPGLLEVTAERAFVASAGAGLVATDLVSPPVTLVAAGALAPRELAAVGPTLYFTNAAGQLGRTDGSPAGTRAVEGLDGGAALRPRRAGSALYFAGGPLSTGLEPWRTFGGPATALAELVPGPGASLPSSFSASPGRLLFAAHDVQRDEELWSLPLADTTLPNVEPVIDGGLGESGWYRTDVSVSWRIIDPDSPALAVFDCEGATLTRDTAGEQLDCVAASEAGDRTVSVVVKRDATAPQLTCPATPPPTEATGPDGGFVSIGDATARDALGPVQIDWSGPRDLPFPLGTTVLTATATDPAGNTSSCQVNVVVRDLTPPSFTCPERIVQATSAAGAACTGCEISTSDTVDREVTVDYVPALTSTFALGSTQVTATARDDSGNSSQCTFTVIVRDTMAPVLSCAPVELCAPTAAEAIVDFAATATDSVDPAPTVEYSREPGTVFPDGETLVTVTATDARGNTSTCELPVRVRVSNECVMLVARNRSPYEFGACGCGASGGAGLVALLTVALLTRRRRRSQ
ncbi:MAG: HYR domain-containing protein [Myxococcaceae bacterium]|nr:HYR domain-containing protein [Myxococcaceae bacterium]